MIEMLLKENPEAAKYRRPDTDASILHLACLRPMPSKLCIEIMKLVLALHKDAVHDTDEDDFLPAHRAAVSCDVAVLEFLLGLHPEAASVVTKFVQNLLHSTVLDSDSSRDVSKVQYLCTRYPAMIQQRDCDGELPVHTTQCYKILRALHKAGGIEQFRTPIAHPTDATLWLNDFLPLHLFMFHQYTKLTSPATSEDADMFRWLLRLYPEAAGIEGGVGARKKRTPYKLAVDDNLPNYYLRLLLRAAPTLNPAELHRLNYAERRMAMFLAFRAVAATVEAPLLARLRGVNKDLVQRVVSFL
jgi:hypothetical protein